MIFAKQTTMQRMEEILSTINKKVIQKIIIKPWSTHSPSHFDGCEITIGYTTYKLFLGDSDPYYADESVRLLINMLKKFDLPYVYDNFEYQTKETRENRKFIL